MSPAQTTAFDHVNEASESIDYLTKALRGQQWISVKFWANDVIKAMEAVKEAVSE